MDRSIKRGFRSIHRGEKNKMLKLVVQFFCLRVCDTWLSKIALWFDGLRQSVTPRSCPLVEYIARRTEVVSDGVNARSAPELSAVSHRVFAGVKSSSISRFAIIRGALLFSAVAFTT